MYKVMYVDQDGEISCIDIIGEYARTHIGEYFTDLANLLKCDTDAVKHLYSFGFIYFVAMDISDRDEEFLEEYIENDLSVALWLHRQKGQSNVGH